MKKRALESKLALITGGSGGIGRVVAAHLAEAGATVCISGSNPERLSRATKDLRTKYRDRIFGLRCDISEAKQVARGFRSAIKKLGGLDILVNAAAIQQPIGEFAENALSSWEHNLQVNLLGTIYCCKLAIGSMEKRGGGSIINFSGGGATSSRTHFSAYAVAKTGVVRFTEILAEELQPRGIRVNAVAPGAVNTGMLDEVLQVGLRAGKAELESARKRAAEGGASAELAADLVVFLASHRSYPLSGKLISAPWDPWQTWDKASIRKIMSGPQYTLRRTT